MITHHDPEHTLGPIKIKSENDLVGGFKPSEKY